MSDVAFKIIKRHLKRPEWHEWVTLGATERLTRTGRKPRGYTYSFWLVFICNNLDCNARAVVNTDGLLGALTGENFLGALTGENKDE